MLNSPPHSVVSGSPSSSSHTPSTSLTVNASTPSDSSPSSSNAASSSKVVVRQAVRIDATLAARSLLDAQMVVLRGTVLADPGSAAPQDVVMRLLIGNPCGMAVYTDVQQVWT